MTTPTTNAAPSGTVRADVRPLRFLADRSEGVPCRVVECIHHDEDFEQHCIAENDQLQPGPEWCRDYEPGEIE